MDTLTKVCNMGKVMDKILKSETIGHWTILSQASQDRVTCRCACGTEKDVYVYSLNGGDSTSCGCKVQRVTEHFRRMEKERGHGPNRKPKGVALLNYVYNSYKHSAKVKGLKFNLTKDQIKEIITKDCHYCGMPPSNEYSSKHFAGAKDFKRHGIDRKDNSEGYVLDNCVPCCKSCNYLKRHYNYEEFINKIATIYERLESYGEG